MTPTPPPPRRSLTLVAVLAVVALGALYLLKQHLQSRAAVAELRKEANAMRGELESRDEVLLDLQRELRRLQLEVQSQPDRSAEDPRVGRLQASVLQLEALQSNIVAGMENMAVTVDELRSRGAAPVEPTEQERRQIKVLGIEALETLLADRMLELQAIQQEVTRARIDLKVPQDIQILDPDLVMRSPTYQRYWPYFELIDELNEHRTRVSALKLRLEQERIEVQLPLLGR